jgi:anti-sigma factor (TIGR02949 family)
MALTRARRTQCAQVAKVLQTYLDGEAPPDKSTMVAEHLEECRKCGMEAETYRAIKASIAHTYRPDAQTEDAVERLRAFVDQLAEPDEE